MQPAERSEIVRELVELLAADRDLRGRVEEALCDRDEQPGDIWRGMTLEGFYRFFDEWHSCLPAIENEQSMLDHLLRFHRTPKGLALVRETPFARWLNRFARARGDFLDGGESAELVRHWADHPDIDLSDFVVPAEGFGSFNEFFTRRVKPGARPIASPDDDSVVVSPADSTIQAALALDSQARLEVKGRSLTLAELLPGEALAERFRDGTAMVLFLGVKDYHRFHAPVAGRILRVGRIGGLCFGCDEYPGQFFTEHHRGYFVFETRGFGLVGMVTVGIATVSSVQLLRAAGEVVAKGDELGYFAYGGSAILLLFEEGQVREEDWIEGRHILMGARIGTLDPRNR
jgi:phosphatidylserine decarboxylase